MKIPQIQSRPDPTGSCYVGGIVGTPALVLLLVVAILVTLVRLGVMRDARGSTPAFYVSLLVAMVAVVLVVRAVVRSQLPAGLAAGGVRL